MPARLRVDKCRLKTTPMYIDYIRSVTELTCDAFKIEIENYSQLKHNVPYEQKQNGQKCSLWLKQNGRSLEITLRTDEIYTDMACSIVYDKRICSYPADVGRTAKGTYYKVDIPHEVVNDPGNAYLKTGRLVLQFTHRKRRRIPTKTFPCRGMRRVLVDQVDNFPSILKFSDFIMDLGDVKIPANKALLAVRSQLFSNFISNHCREGKVGRFELFGIPTAMTCILHYLYNGELVIRSKDEVISVFHMSMMIGLTKLQKLCEIFLNEN